MLYCILFPADKINIKEILFLVVLVVCGPSIYSGIKEGRYNYVLIFGLLYPLFTTIISVTLGSSSVVDALSYGYVWLYLLLIPAIDRYGVDIKKPFIIGTTLVVLITDFIFLTDILGIIPFFSNPVGLFFKNINEIQGYGKGIYSTFGYSIFYKSLPLAFFSYGYAIKHKKWLMIVLYLMAFLVCGTRANLLVALCMTAAIPLLSAEKPSKKAIIAVILIIIAVIFLPDFIDYYTARSSLKYGSSDLIKIEAIESIFKFLNDDKTRYIFGSGVGSYFYSSGRGTMVNLVEVSFFDYFRQVGLLGYIFFIYFLIIPFRKYFANERWVLIAYLGYLAIALTNPLLVSSTSFMGYILILSRSLINNDYPNYTGR